MQLEFYGRLHWAVMVRVALPLAIFHRFHSAVVLTEVWKPSDRARAAIVSLRGRSTRRPLNRLYQLEASEK